jgi:RNA polymerase-binding transcription factor DksA
MPIGRVRCRVLQEISMDDDSRQPGDRDHLRHQLERRRRELVDDVQRRLSRIRQADERAALSENAEEDVSDIDVGLVDIISATVNRIDAALERIADGGYGVCSRCGGRISEARLRAMPFAVCCQRCESARERDSTDRTRLRPSLWDESHVVVHSDER